MIMEMRTKSIVKEERKVTRLGSVALCVGTLVLVYGLLLLANWVFSGVVPTDEEVEAYLYNTYVDCYSEEAYTFDAAFELEMRRVENSGIVIGEFVVIEDIT